VSSTFHGITPGVAFGKPGPFDVGSAAPPNPLLTGLVSWWKLDEESGVRADSHGSNDLTDNNTVLYAAGKIGNAAAFVAANSESLSRATNPLIGSTSFSVSLWLDDWTGRPFTIDRESAGKRLTTLIGTGGNIVYVFNTAGGNVSVATGAFPGGWTMVTWTFDVADNKLRLWVNNVLKGTSSALAGTVNLDAICELYIGCGNFTGTPAYFNNGNMDLVGIWSRALTSDEVTELYNLGAGKDYPF